MKKTQIIIAGQRLWPLRWQFVLESAARVIYHLLWFGMGDVALISLMLNSPYVGIRLRWEMIDLLHRLGVTQEGQVVISVLVVAMFMGRQMWGIVDVFWPGRGGRQQ